MLAILEKDIEWPTLAFFIFLFVLVGAAVATGLIESLAHGLAWMIDAISRRPRPAPTGDAAARGAARAVGLGFLSAVIDNIPYTAVTIPLVASLLASSRPARTARSCGGRWRSAPASAATAR